jgi:hypothetical protein
MTSIARIFGAPVTLPLATSPTGCRETHALPGRADDRRDAMHLSRRSRRAARLPPSRSRLHTREIVSLDVDDHRELGALFGSNRARARAVDRRIARGARALIGSVTIEPPVRARRTSRTAPAT